MTTEPGVEPFADTRAPAALDAGSDATWRPPRQTRKSASRRRFRRSLIVTHRWLSLVLGLLLLMITTTGAILLYKPEIVRWLNADAYAAADVPAATTPQQAVEAVAAAHPAFTPTTVIAEHGVLRVTDFQISYTVDPATGLILGEIGELPTWLAWTGNFHECLLTCEDEVGYIGALAAPAPGTGWLGFEEPVTVGGLILGLGGLLLLFLALSGLWLWVPKPGRWKSAVTVRRGKGRFARDTDLHKIIGMIALPLLLLWAVTGMGFEFGVVEDAWYAMTPGDEREAPEVVSTDGTGPDIGIDAAAAAALVVVPGATLAAVDLPPDDDPSAAYSVWVTDGIDPYAHGDYPGDVNVSVDRRTGEATVGYGGPQESTAQSLWESWNYTTHAGIVVNGWWRLIWLALGLAPLALAVTGVSTWLVRRRTRKRRQAAKSRVSPGSSVADRVGSA